MASWSCFSRCLSAVTSWVVYMSGPVTPSDPYELEGSYTAMIERLQGLVVGDEAKAEVAKLYDKHTARANGCSTA